MRGKLATREIVVFVWGMRNNRWTPAASYRAKLLVETLVGGKGGPAAVGLFGVDDSLGQLVALPGPGDMARVMPVATPSQAPSTVGIMDSASSQ